MNRTEAIQFALYVLEEQRESTNMDGDNNDFIIECLECENTLLEILLEENDGFNN
jgi:hypothetical protein|tara:strand:+ start:308 stop:472 length:165 start_codon:yes stop_codon:yes gene_type:complete